jgi:hypothetical protein
LVLMRAFQETKQAHLRTISALVLGFSLSTWIRWRWIDPSLDVKHVLLLAVIGTVVAAVTAFAVNILVAPRQIWAEQQVASGQLQRSVDALRAEMKEVRAHLPVVLLEFPEDKARTLERWPTVRAPQGSVLNVQVEPFELGGVQFLFNPVLQVGPEPCDAVTTAQWKEGHKLLRAIDPLFDVILEYPPREWIERAVSITYECTPKRRFVTYLTLRMRHAGIPGTVYIETKWDRTEESVTPSDQK